MIFRCRFFVVFLVTVLGRLGAVLGAKVVQKRTLLRPFSGDFPTGANNENPAFRLDETPLFEVLGVLVSVFFSFFFKLRFQAALGTSFLSFGGPKGSKKGPQNDPKF